MPHHTDGMQGVVDPDDVFSSSTDVGRRPQDVSFSAMTDTASVRAQLQRLLDSKESQLQQAGALGQRILAQQIELDQRVRQLQDIDADRGEQDEPSDELRLKYRELAKTIKGWNEENAKLSSSFITGQRAGGSEQPPSPPTLPLPDLPQEALSHTPSTPSASQSRRAKNAAHRANDVEFAFEIGSSLLTEVRRLQSLLAERDKAIQNMKEEKDDLEKAVEALRTALREQEQNADKFKEENWNLEVSLQEIRVQLANAQASAQRGESETKRLTKILASTREANDASKNEVERLQRTIEESKNKHETDVALHRKHAAALAREKSDLQQSVDTYKTELARASRRLPRFGSPYNTPGGMSEAQTPRLGEDDDDLFGPGTGGVGVSTNRRRMDTSGLFPPDAFGVDYVDASPDPSPSRPFMSPNHPSNEIEALQQKLAHAQRQINTLKSTLTREKELRIEYRRKMLEAGMQGQKLDDEEEKEEEAEVEVKQQKPKPRSTPFRGRGRGRGRGSLSSLRNGGRTLAQKLMAAQMHANEDSDEDEEVLQEDSDAYPSTTVPDTTSDERTVDTSMTSAGMSSPTRSSFPSPEPLSNRASVTSVEGMDPEFANILRRAPSQSSASRRGSPFMRGTTRGGRGLVGRRRGGTAFQEPRPSSLVGAPEALAAELGLANTSVGMESVREDVSEPSGEMKEISCQTEFEEPLPLPPPSAPEPIKSEVADMGVQAEAVPEPVPEVIKPETAEMSVQVAPEPEPEVLAPEMVEMAVQSDPIPDLKPTIIEVPVPAPVVEVPHIFKTNFAMQTIPPELKSASTSTDPEVRPVLVDNSSQMEAPARAKTSEMVVQTDPIPEPEPIIREVLVRPETPKQAQRSEAETQTTPRTETFPNSLPGVPTSPLAQRRLRYLSTASNATAVPVRALQTLRDEDEDTDTDAPTELAYASAAEPETETDAEDYRDARSAAPTPTITESVNDDDFHSMSTMTDNDYSDDDESEDAQSIRAPVANAEVQFVGASSGPDSEHDVPIAPSVTYESMGIETDPPKEELKRELSEVSIQTDEWQPSPIISPVPRVPTGFGMYRVGPSSQQFQFVPHTASTPATALSTPVTPNIPSIPSNTLRDTANTVAARPMRFSSPSLPDGGKLAHIEGTPEYGQRQHTQSLTTASPTVDKSRPPTMMLPPPPKMPPPPNSMPPPSFIPEKRRPTSALSSNRDMPPPRPSSPPPPELIQRATTPTFGSVLTVPNRSMSGGRQQGSSLPPMSVLRQPTSMNSFRSVAQSTAHAQMSSGSSHTPFVDRRLQSAASLLSDGEDMLSRRSSISSDFHHNRTISDGHAGAAVLNTPGTPSRAANMPSSSTDPTVIHAITQTMIGEFLYKYTRRAIGKGHGERRHKRFFWVHPYTKTLYWSSGDPGSTNVTEQSAKSAYIDSVRSVLDPNPMPPGLYQYSIVISTPQREMKFTAPTKERHEIWLNALNFLLARPTPVAAQSPTATQVHGPPVTPVRGNSNILEQGGIISPTRTGRTEKSGMSNESPWSVANVTPRGARRSRSRVSVAGSVGKRSGTPAAEYLRWTDGPGSPGSTSAHGFELSHGTELDDDELDFEIHDSAMSDREGYEGLENVRACCDGKHTVGRGHDHDHDHDHVHSNGHKHAYIHRPIPQFARNDSAAEHLHPGSRPSSPAFSFRSRSSRKSGDGVGNLFSRFGTRRSKTPAVSQEG